MVSEKVNKRGCSPHHFSLRIKRQDIATHLGIANETMSCIFHTLCTDDVISVQNKDISILNMNKLSAMCC
jgi:CRP/FNR family transcriptional regulator